MLKLINVAALAAAFAGTASEAQGQAAAGTYSVAIRSGDLNLASPGGLATFRGRVHAGAAQACGDEKVAPLAEATQIAQCRAGFARAAEGRVSLALARQDTAVAGTR
ncbi:MAG TPA: UrcA family protein [Allosphingosinicella sp.]|jgi:UrcA family protein